MNTFIKKYPVEAMGILFASVFFTLAMVSCLQPVSDNRITIPIVLAGIVFTILLVGLIMIYYNAYKPSLDELFLMMAAICASLSDGFWIFALLAVICLLVRRRKVLTINSVVFKAWGIMIFVALTSSFFATESTFLAFGASFGLIVYALIFVAVEHQDYTITHGKDFLQRIGVLLAFSVITAVLFSLWHLFFFPHLISVLIFQFQPSTGYGDSFGVASIFGHWPTHSSAFLVMSFWVLAGIYVNSELNKARKIIIMIGILAALTGTLATLSRNAFLFLVVSFGIFFLLVLFKPMYKKYLLPLLGTGGLLGAILLFYLSRFSKWKDLLQNPWQQTTVAQRLEQYQFGWEYFIESANQWFGVGLMNFGPLYRKYADPDGATYLHQLFLSFLLEIGYIGLAAFMAVLWVIGRNIFIGNKSDIFKVIFISWLFMGIFDNWLYFMWSSTLFMLIMAVGSSQQEWYRKS